LQSTGTLTVQRHNRQHYMYEIIVRARSTTQVPSGWSPSYSSAAGRRLQQRKRYKVELFNCVLPSGVAMAHVAWFHVMLVTLLLAAAVCQEAWASPTSSSSARQLAEIGGMPDILETHDGCKTLMNQLPYKFTLCTGKLHCRADCVSWAGSCQAQYHAVPSHMHPPP
jgi:hypothetical protein